MDHVRNVFVFPRVRPPYSDGLIFRNGVHGIASPVAVAVAVAVAVSCTLFAVCCLLYVHAECCTLHHVCCNTCVVLCT